MNGSDDQDWERLNAFHDGEMPADEAEAFRRKLASDADLAAEAARLTEVSAALAAMRPDRPGPAPKPSRKAVLSWLAGAAVAASVAALVLGGVLERAPVKPLDRHEAFLALDFPVSHDDLRLAAASHSVEQPDLTGGNLAPVALVAHGRGTVAHYAGRNGCRLTYFRGPDALDLPSDAGAQASSWTTGDGLHHAILATGMDVGKFDGIAAWLQHRTRQLANAHIHAAMVDATTRARRCVG